MTTHGPPPGGRTLSHLIQAAAAHKCSYCKAGPREPCTWPGPDRYHVARFTDIGMTQAERRHVEAATRPGLGRTSPKGYLVGELRPYRQPQFAVSDVRHSRRTTRHSGPGIPLP